MPLLPSGLDLALSRDAIIIHDSSWFQCPEGHFWYWDVDSDITGPPPFARGEEIWQVPRHAKIPTSREEVARFIRVLERAVDGRYWWRGDWLSTFPSYSVLSSEDGPAWLAWLSGPEVQTYLDNAIDVCATMAERVREVYGWVGFSESPKPTRPSQ